MTRRGATASLWAVAAAAIAAGVAAEAIAARHGEATTYAGRSSVLAVLEFAAAAALVAGGLLSWQRPRVGVAAVAAGLGWLAPDFAGWDAGLNGVRSIGLLLLGVTAAAVAQLVAVAPSGRTVWRPARLFVAVVYAELALVTVGRALFRDPYADPDCWSDCAVNVLLVHGDAGLARFLTHADLAFAVIVGVALPPLAAGRWRAATPAARRALWPVLAAGSSFAVAQGLWAARVLTSAPEDPDRAVFAALFAARSAALLALGAALVWTVVRTARSRAAVGRLIGDLRDAPASLALQDVLARAVGDAGLVVAYPVGDRHVDAYGRPVAVPAPGGPVAVTSIERDGAPVALVLHDPAALSERDLAGEIGAAVRVAVDNERLQAQSQAQLRELRASRVRVVETADATRRRLERDLHDGAQQRLVSLALMLQLAMDSVDPQVAAQLPVAGAELRAATVELRELAHGIHPAALSEEGLAPAVRALADRIPLAIDALELPSSRPSPAAETAAYYLVDEVARSSQAARVSLRSDTAVLAIELVADGVPAPALSHVRDRIAALDGELLVEEGRVSARIPFR